MAPEDVVIGIRREDKNRWERRVALTPEHVAELTRHGLRVLVQPSPVRAFPDEAFRRAGAAVCEDLAPCTLVVGVKEIPVEALLPGATYMFFAHVAKGQPGNMPMLRRLLELGCTLVDYEKIVDDRGRRLVFFGRHAGIAGMLDTLWALGRRLSEQGVDSPFAAMKLAHEYADLEEAHVALDRLADDIRGGGLPEALHPIVVGFTGSGHTSRGAQEILDHLPHEDVLPEDLANLLRDPDYPRNLLYKVVFSRADRVRRIDGGPCDPAALASDPAAFASSMGSYLPHLTALVNGVYWEPGQPRVVSVADLRALWAAPGAPRLRVIADIACDVGGSVEATIRITTPGDPVFVYDVDRGDAVSGVSGRGPVILAVDNLPCQLPVDASEHFGDGLLRFLPVLARCDWAKPFAQLEIPPEIRGAVIVHRGRLTPAYNHLARHLAGTASAR